MMALNRTAPSKTSLGRLNAISLVASALGKTSGSSLIGWVVIVVTCVDISPGLCLDTVQRYTSRLCGWSLASSQSYVLYKAG